jgi:hypothetical protein
MAGRQTHLRRLAAPTAKEITFPLNSPLSVNGEGLNTMGSYMYSLVQKSANTNWRGIRSSLHELRKVAVTHRVA